MYFVFLIASIKKITKYKILWLCLGFIICSKLLKIYPVEAVNKISYEIKYCVVSSSIFREFI